MDKIQLLQEFDALVKLVGSMRYQQKLYYSTDRWASNKPVILARSRELEKRVDEYLKRCKKICSSQSKILTPTLDFGGLC